MNEFHLRVASAVVLAPVALGALWAGGLAFALLVAVGAAIMVVEWRTIVGLTDRPLTVFLSGLIIGLAQIVAWRWGFLPGLVIVGAVAVLTAAGAVVVGARDRALLVLTGCLYAGLPGLAAIDIRAGAVGGAAMAFIFTVVWATDIGAYFVGRKLGGPKLWPRVSPKKTWSGAIGGLAAGILVGIAIVWGTGHGFRPMLIVIAGLLSIVSQGGDLFESSLKRRFGVKDSGTIIPGHGGLLDRVDGLVAALALAWIIGALFGLSDVSTGVIALQK